MDYDLLLLLLWQRGLLRLLVHILRLLRVLLRRVGMHILVLRRLLHILVLHWRLRRLWLGGHLTLRIVHHVRLLRLRRGLLVHHSLRLRLCRVRRRGRRRLLAVHVAGGGRRRRLWLWLWLWLLLVLNRLRRPVHRLRRLLRRAAHNTHPDPDPVLRLRLRLRRRGRWGLRVRVAISHVRRLRRGSTRHRGRVRRGRLRRRRVHHGDGGRGRRTQVIEKSSSDRMMIYLGDGYALQSANGGGMNGLCSPALGVRRSSPVESGDTIPYYGWRRVGPHFTCPHELTNAASFRFGLDHALALGSLEARVRQLVPCGRSARLYDYGIMVWS